MARIRSGVQIHVPLIPKPDSPHFTQLSPLINPLLTHCLFVSCLVFEDKHSYRTAQNLVLSAPIAAITVIVLSSEGLVLVAVTI
jgi:hypothetical protein